MIAEPSRNGQTSATRRTFGNITFGPLSLQLAMISV
jgi:hypothetical protein